MQDKDMKGGKRELFDKQEAHWEGYLSSVPDMFGEEPSESARIALDLLRDHGVRDLLELGGGQGRDTFLFAAEGINVQVLDYSESAVKTISEKARREGLEDRVRANRFDLRQPLPYPGGLFDACYAHMLLCMALTEEEVALLCAEVRRVLGPGGVFIYTVRNTQDPHYGQGTHFGEGVYETKGGFIVHFFDREKIERLADGFEIITIDQCEETSLPKKMFRVVLKKR